jgi:hypothetical protein
VTPLSEDSSLGILFRYSLTDIPLLENGV